jgi:membrane associated rhomboid family serine protease
MQSLYHGRALAGLLVKRTLRRQTGVSQQSRFFTSSPQSQLSNISATKRPRPATMNSYQLARTSTRHFGGWHPNRFQSTKTTVNIIIGLNLAVFGGWMYADSFKDVKLQKLLMDNATLSWANARAKRYWTLVTSAFSHKDFMHILFNMVSFEAFASVLCFAGGVGVGPAHVVYLTLGSAVAGAAAWLYQKQPQGRDKRWGLWGEHGLAATRHVGLGFSGVVMGFSAVATCLAPMLRTRFFIIPISMPMWVLTSAYFAWDLFYLNSDDRVGRSAHLGGAVFGVVYYLAALRGYGGIAHMLSRRRY